MSAENSKSAKISAVEEPVVDSVEESSEGEKKLSWLRRPGKSELVIAAGGAIVGIMLSFALAKLRDGVAEDEEVVGDPFVETTSAV